MARDGERQPLDQLVAIGEAGERIEAGQVGDFFGRTAAFGYVPEGQADDMRVRTLLAVMIKAAVHP